MQKSVETLVTCQVLEDGCTVLPGKLFGEIVRKLPEGTVDINTDDTSATIRCGKSRMHMQTMPTQDFPDLPEVDEENTIVIKQGKFRNMIRQTIFASATSEQRPILTGLYVEFENDTLTMVGLDGFRLAMRVEEMEYSGPKLTAVIPAASMAEIAKLMNSEDSSAYISIGKAYIVISIGVTRMVSRLLEGEFIKFRQVIPEKWLTRIKIDKKDFEHAIDRASTIAHDGRSNLIRMNIMDGVMTVSSNSEMGNTQEEISVVCEGETGKEIAFNGQYITEVMRNLDEEEIYLCLTSSVSPCVIRPVSGGDEYTYMVLPVRVYV